MVVRRDHGAAGHQLGYHWPPRLAAQPDKWNKLPTDQMAEGVIMAPGGREEEEEEEEEEGDSRGRDEEWTWIKVDMKKQNEAKKEEKKEEH
ncbi:hypothetical protein E2C01_082035 [Portunus trituberculatus]|uniref:Uncharacterized protein n=1 Tax=Portunus trituberculatus TaxID=210409 RepID=A0A5B7ITH1_PORTR|nr:hypothetical protein [Portunus trituberculatus]